jgi:hypothetical protein
MKQTMQLLQIKIAKHEKALIQYAHIRDETLVIWNDKNQ